MPEEICKQDPNLYMASLNVDSVWTNLIFHWTKPLIFALIVCIKMMRIPLIDSYGRFL